MKDILQTMYDMLSREARRGTVLFINFSKPHVERIGCKNATCIYIAENEEQKLQVEKNINRHNTMYEAVMTFETGKGKTVVNNLEEWMKKKKFDGVIGNPPYAGNGKPLYLRVLEQVKPVADETIWLCPSQWVKNYKDSAYIAEMKKTICKDLIEHENVGNPFSDAGLANEVTVFHFGKADKYEDYEELRLERFANPALAKTIWNKFETYGSNLGEMTRVDLNKKKYVYASEIRGHFHESKPCWDWTTLFGEDQRNTIYETKLECHWHFWNFDTNKECRNFIKSTETDILMFALYIGKVHNKNNAVTLSLIPWFGDYTHEWPEDMIQKELGLTDEEVAYIHEEMKDFGWKTRK